MKNRNKSDPREVFGRVGSQDTTLDASTHLKNGVRLKKD